jgi:hypothetical protein
MLVVVLDNLVALIHLIRTGLGVGIPSVEAVLTTAWQTEGSGISVLGLLPAGLPVSLTRLPSTR